MQELLLPAIVGLLGDKVNSFEVPKLATVIIIGFLFIAITKELGPKLLIVSGIIMLIILTSFLKKRSFQSKFLTLAPNQILMKVVWNTITIQVMKRSVFSMSM